MNNNNTFWIKACSGLLLIAIVFDIVPYPYWCAELEYIFEYDPGNVLEITTMMWGFATALFLFYLERRTEQTYGIRLVTALRCIKTDAVVREISYFSVLQLIVLIVAAMYEFMIAITFSVILELITMVCIFLFVHRITSPEGIIKCVQYQIKTYSKSDERISSFSLKQYESCLLVKMIRGVDYSKQEDVENVYVLIKHFLNRTEDILGRRLAQILIEEILGVGGYCDNAINLIKNLVAKENLEIKKGVMAALVCQMNTKNRTNQELLKSLIEVSGEHYEELKIWYFEYNSILKQYEGQWFREKYAIKPVEKSIQWSKSNIEKALEYHKEIEDDIQYYSKRKES